MNKAGFLSFGHRSDHPAYKTRTPGSVPGYFYCTPNCCH